ncbi:ribonuclease P protein component [candidate division Kazan bacterium]|uniref:Ribonuclease P protein component n=1 Tax=candidate division Kazan bacterium TaxID=2202143 RepID=A0A420ZDB3_UNCK3|nr:MAG: ribonuclease P protein component [candidate division Kazan bacterium]
MSKLTKGAPERIIRQGRSIHGRGFVIYFLEAPYKVEPRIVISNKVDKRAVVRNKLRRQIKNILRDINFSNLGLVVIVKKEILKLNFQRLRQNFLKAFKKI